jgi:hypothetical protein
VEAGGMTELTLGVWCLIAAVIAVCVVCTLYVLAAIVRDASRRIELYQRVAQLRAEYDKRMTEITTRGLEIDHYSLGGVDIVPDARKKAA